MVARGSEKATRQRASRNFVRRALIEFHKKRLLRGSGVRIDQAAPRGRAEVVCPCRSP